MTQETKVQPVSIQILGKDYRIACSDGEQDALIRSAQQLDQQMREIRDSGTVTGTDRIAVMAALNLTHELSHTQSEPLGATSNISSSLANLRFKIEKVLESI